MKTKLNIEQKINGTNRQNKTKCPLNVYSQNMYLLKQYFCLVFQLEKNLKCVLDQINLLVAKIV